MNSYKIAFLNSKGGVGKSTLCILSALGLSQTRFDGKIKLIDTDSQKSSLSILNQVSSKIELDFILLVDEISSISNFLFISE